MNADHKNRLLIPVLLPLGVLLAALAFIGAIAFSLLNNTHEGSLMLAAVVAGGILFTVSLASSSDKLDAPRRGVIVLAAALPLLVGLGLATDLIPGVTEEARMANVEPLQVIPEDAPVIAAENSTEFCLPTEDGGCEPVDRWEVAASEQVENVVFIFDNRESGIQHNVVISELEGTADDPQRGTDILSTELIFGPATDEHYEPGVNWADLPEEWYFFCIVHPAMDGVGTLATGEA